MYSVHSVHRISNEDLNVSTGIPVITTKWWITIECRHFLVSQRHISSACLKLGTQKRDKFGLNGKKFVHNHLVQLVVSTKWFVFNGTFIQIRVQLTNVEINLSALFCSTWTAYILNRWMGFSSSFNYKVSHNNWNWNIRCRLLLYLLHSILCQWYFWNETNKNLLHFQTQSFSCIQITNYIQIHIYPKSVDLCV